MKASFLLFLIAVIPAKMLFAAEPPGPRHGDKLIIVNDDGFSQFHSGRYRTAAALRGRVGSLAATQVALVEQCIVAGCLVNFSSPVPEFICAGVPACPRRCDQIAA